MTGAQGTPCVASSSDPPGSTTSSMLASVAAQSLRMQSCLSDLIALAFMSQLKDGCSLQIGMVFRQFKCSKSTAKRDLASLKDKGLIEFDGPAKTGHYRLKKLAAR